MVIDKDLLLAFLSIIIMILGAFIGMTKKGYDDKLQEITERVKDAESKLGALQLVQITHGSEIKYIGEAVNRVEQGFKDQERKREKFLEAIQSQINVLAEKIGELKK